MKLALELVEARHGAHALHPGRADHGPALPRHRAAAHRAAPAARPRQHGGRHRAQPRRHQDARTGSSTSDRRAAREAGRSSRRERPKPSPHRRRATRGTTSSRCSTPRQKGGASRNRRRVRRAVARCRATCWGRSRASMRRFHAARIPIVRSLARRREPGFAAGPGRRRCNGRRWLRAARRIPDRSRHGDAGGALGSG